MNKMAQHSAAEWEQLLAHVGENPLGYWHEQADKLRMQIEYREANHLPVNDALRLQLQTAERYVLYYVNRKLETDQ